MGTRIDVQTGPSWNADSQAWLANRKGMDTCRPITVDLALFTADHCPNGFVPSGTALAKVTATGKYGPYTTAGAGGLETCAGLLFDSIQMESAADDYDVAAALFWEGIVVSSRLPAFANTTDGELDAAGRTDLGHIRFE